MLFLPMINEFEAFLPCDLCVCFTLTDVHMMKNNNKLGVFIAAAVGTLTLMAVVYCIYNQFYTKNIYTHSQLHESGTRRINRSTRASQSQNALQ